MGYDMAEKSCYDLLLRDAWYPEYFFSKIQKKSSSVICNSHPEPYELQVWKNLSTYATCLLIELCQIVVTLWENQFIRPWSRSRTSIHPSIHPQKNSMLYHVYLSPKLSTWCMGYTKRNKRYIPKEGMPHAHKACQKKRKRKDAYPKKVCHTPTRCVKKKEREKENIAHTKNITREREFI